MDVCIFDLYLFVMTDQLIKCEFFIWFYIRIKFSYLTQPEYNSPTQKFMLTKFQTLNRYFKSLTKVDAERRAEQVKAKSINYKFYLLLHPGDNYQGCAQLQFQLNSSSKESVNKQLFLDFQGKSVDSCLINGISPNKDIFNSKEGKIYLPDQFLMKNTLNKVLIQYTNKYDNDGSGCVSFIDVDKKQYLYTQFQPYLANRVFPLFDQPDLKARMELAVSCHQSWPTVISNQHIKRYHAVKQSINQLLSFFTKNPSAKTAENKFYSSFIQKTPENYHTTVFNSTKLLSSYLYCFVVGPYKKFPLAQTYRNIPMNLYCIDSLFPEMMQLVPLISEMTNKSMQFFEKYFGYEYPFSKYDQVFAHQYKWGAMQNAGIVTFNDHYLFKDKVSNQRLLGFSNTIVHELAHHWFGNLVTMKWWDDLWLNQSFAEYISHFCLQKIKSEVSSLNYQSAMTSFYYRKGWGYTEDQMQTTHAIRGTVDNTEQAESIFDGITYAKGAATMKQLMYLLGQQNFSKALSSYFHKFEYKNAVLDDLLQELGAVQSSKSLPISMQEWKKQWLQNPGVNVLSCQWSPQTIQKDRSFTIKQSSFLENHNTLRTHRIKIALLYKGSAEKPVELVPLELTVSNKNTTLVQCNHKPPQAIILNYGDLSFVKTSIDPISLNFLKENLKYLYDCQDGQLLSSMIWRNFYEMVTEAKMLTKEYIQIALANLFDQKSDSLVQEQLNFIFESIRAYTPQIYRQEYYNWMAQKCLQKLNQIKRLPKQQKQRYQNRIVFLRANLIKFSESQQKLGHLLSWLTSTSHQTYKQDVFYLSISQRWSVLKKLYGLKSLNKEDKKGLFQHMANLDKSDVMICNKYAFQAANADEGDLESIYKTFIDLGGTISTTYLTNSMLGFNHKNNFDSVRKNYFSRYFQDIVAMDNATKNDKIETFIHYMNPIGDRNVSQLDEKMGKFSGIVGRLSNDKHRILIEKKIEVLKKRKQAYVKYQK